MRVISQWVLLLFAAGAFAEETTTGANEASTRQAIERSLPLITSSALKTIDQKRCFTCHHEALPSFVFAEASDRGFTVEPGAMAALNAHTAKFLKIGKSLYEEGRGQGGKVDLAGYALWSLDIGNWPADDVTTAVTGYILGKDKGHWTRSNNRPPMEASAFTTTYLALYALDAYGTDGQQQAIANRQAAVKEWLENAEPKDTEDRVFRLRMLPYLEVNRAQIDRAQRDLLAQQRPDGGWAQTANLESDAYATGTALTALAETGFATNSEAYRQGLAFLLETQQADGSWRVKTRSRPIQDHFESGFPHGKDQFISCTATCWATLALIHSL